MTAPRITHRTPAARIGRGARRALITFGILALTLLAAPVSAAAHTELTASDPADGSRIDTAPEQITLTFNEPVRNLNPVLIVTGPNGNTFTDGPATVAGAVVTAPLLTAGPPGEYRAAYRVISTDGHAVTGQITYTLTDKAAGTATGASPTNGTPTAADPASRTTSGPPTWAWIATGLAGLAILTVVIITLARRRPPTGN